MIVLIIFLILYLLFVITEIVFEYFKLKELRRDYENLWNEIRKVEEILFEDDDKSQRNIYESI